jgi:ABC-type dipeptide/oligopeptide/nickel transport system permease subunit
VAPASLWRITLRRLFKRRSALAGMIILGFLALVAILAPWIAPYSPTEVLIGKEDIRKRAPPCIRLLGCPEDQPQHIMGVDGNVRDVFSRVIHGTRLSLMVGFTTVGIAIVIGVTLGALAGYFGGRSDNLIMRVLDVLLAFPSLLLAIAIVAVIGPGLQNALLAIAIVSIPAYARVMRASVLSVKETEFVAASRAHTPDRPGNARHRDRDPRRRGALISRPRCPAAYAGVGDDVGRGAQSDLHLASPRIFPWTGDHDHCTWI